MRTSDTGDLTADGRMEFVDQFDVNCSQINIESAEQRFVNPAAKLSESDSTSSNLSTTTSENNGALAMLVKSLHQDTRFNVKKVRDQSARRSSLKIIVPKQYVDIGEGSADEPYALALVDKRSNTIHNIQLSEYGDRQIDSMGLTPTTSSFAQHWKEKTRQRRTQRSSTEARRSLLRQISCPNSMALKTFHSESLSSQSDDSTSGNNTIKMETSLTSIDETIHKR